MMEFTYEGVVRQGFGFYNPNHAAALFCALQPFLWEAVLRGKSRSIRIAAGTLSILLFAGLVLTFSRTGILVLSLEGVLFCVLHRVRNWKWIAGIAVSAAVVLTLSGLAGRFQWDGAASNRPMIWRAGLSLAAANPVCGVGLGNSGTLASAFLLPESVVCRTLVNSHLTLLAEFGLFIGFLWLTWIGYALLNGVRLKAAWIAFLGLTLSACSASVFDWDVLFDFRDFGHLSTLNFGLSWILLLLYLGLGVWLCSGRFRWKTAGIAGGVSLALCLCVFGFRNERAPTVEKGFVVRSGHSMPPALYDDVWNLKTVLPFLKDGYRLPVRSWQNRKDAPSGTFREVWLFGECAHFAAQFPDAELIFVSPPENFPLPGNTAKLYLKRFRESHSQGKEVEYY